MNFHRSYDLSFLRDSKKIEYLQHAIQGVNLACSDTVNAWLYIEQALLFNDENRILGSHDTIPNTIFNSMKQDMHSPQTMSWTVSNLYSCCHNYENWRIQVEESHSIEENKEAFWSLWRTNVLASYYRSGASIGSILDNFFRSREQRGDAPPELEKELTDLLGTSLDEKLERLATVFNYYSSPYLVSYNTALIRQRDSLRKELDMANQRVNEARHILAGALESKNPVAILAAMNPGWSSSKFNTSDEYIKAIEFLRGQGVQFSANNV
jgi:hypothetical protein